MGKREGKKKTLSTQDDMPELQKDSAAGYGGENRHHLHVLKTNERNQILLKEAHIAVLKNHRGQTGPTITGAKERSPSGAVGERKKGKRSAKNP